MPVRIDEFNDVEFRGDISQITERYSELPEKGRLQRVFDHIPGIESLQAKRKHSIALIERVNPDDKKSWDFNCFRYAFDMRTLSPRIKGVLENQSQIVPHLDFGSEFIEFLIQNRKKSFIEQKELRLACVVIYLDDKEVRHAGRVIDSEFVVSKWGCLGHLWRHRLWEIPVCYGNNTKFFSVIPSGGEITDAFLAFATWQSEKWDWQRGKRP